MNLFLIRHGIAVDRGVYATDEARPLTEAGRERTGAIAHRLQSLGLHFDLILSSPLVRAQQTAEILHATGLSPQLSLSDTLAPEGDLAAWLTWLTQWRRTEAQGTQAHGTQANSLALVGHEPNLSDWATQLIWGQALAGDRRGETASPLILKKAGIIGLSLPEGHSVSPLGVSQLLWLTPPRFLL